MSAHCYVPTDGRQVAYILSPSCISEGYRVTRWDNIGPAGHTEHATLDAARERVDYEAKYEGPFRLATRDPGWLGLTVITGGRVEQVAS